MDNDQINIEIAALSREIANLNRTNGNRCSFSAAIRDRVASLALSQAVGITPLAKRLGIRVNLLYNWTARFKQRDSATTASATFVPVQITAGDECETTATNTPADIVVRTPHGIALSGLDIHTALEAMVWLDGRI